MPKNQTSVLAWLRPKRDEKPSPLVIEDSELSARGIVNALVSRHITPDTATNWINRLVEYKTGKVC